MNLILNASEAIGDTSGAITVGLRARTLTREGLASRWTTDDLAPGDYRVRMVVAGDGSFAEGTIAVWPPGVQAIVSDIDGTLTTSDGEMFRDLAMKSDAKMYPDANTALRALSQKGYRVVYLSGRAQYVNRYTRDWLAKHDFPPGPLLLTEEKGEVAPTIAGVASRRPRNCRKPPTMRPSCATARCVARASRSSTRRPPAWSAMAVYLSCSWVKTR
jgi:hypothetical protein